MKKVKTIPMERLTDKDNKHRDNIGKRVGKLVIIDFKRETIYEDRYKITNKYYILKCDCGNITKRVTSSLRFDKDNISCWDCIVHLGHITHGLSSTDTYKCWSSMKNLVYKYDKKYGYGVVKLHKPWNQFKNFLQDLGKKPKGHYLIRIDTKGNYEPSNCMWLIKSKYFKKLARSKLKSNNQT